MRTFETTLYAFSELGPDAQETAIENWRNYRDCTWDSNDADMVTDAEGWQEYKLAPFGISINTHTIPLHGGGTRQEPEVWWSDPFSQGASLDFPFTVDVPQFMRAAKLAGKYRSLYDAACAGDIGVSCDTRHYSGSRVRYSVELEYTGTRDTGTWSAPNSWYQRMETQLLAVQDAIQETYDDIRRDWLRAIADELLDQSSDERIREELTEFYDHLEFTEDGDIA